jgi:hypothetical protein
VDVDGAWDGLGGWVGRYGKADGGAAIEDVAVGFDGGAWG